jgi:hypothetical protein
MIPYDFVFSVTIRIYTLLYLRSYIFRFFLLIILEKMRMFSNVQTINLTCVGKKLWMRVVKTDDAIHPDLMHPLLQCRLSAWLCLASRHSDNQPKHEAVGILPLFLRPSLPSSSHFATRPSRGLAADHNRRGLPRLATFLSVSWSGAKTSVASGSFDRMSTVDQGRRETVLS